jgi:hypothetical protein
MDHWDRTDCLEVNPSIYSWLFFFKAVKMCIGERTIFSVSGTHQTVKPYEDEWDYTSRSQLKKKQLKLD